MVTRSRPGYDRGQLLLVSAIVLAMIIFGMAILLNAAVTTDVRAPDDPSTDITESERLGLDLETGVAGLGAHLNVDNLGQDESQLRGDFETNLIRFNNATFEAVGDRRATLSRLSFSDVTMGTLVADGDRESDLTLADETNEDHSIRISEEDATVIKGLVFSINTSIEDIEDAAGVQLWGEDECVLFSFVSTEDGVTIYEQRFDSEDCDDENTIIEPGEFVDQCEGDFARIVIGPDEPENEDFCYVDGFADLEPFEDGGYGLSIRNPEAAYGGYQFLIASDFYSNADGYHDFDAEDTEHPYVAPVIWSVDIDIDQRARASERSVTRTVDIYADREHIDLLGVPWS